MEEKSAIVIVAYGFEEIETVCCIDILRRAGVKVTVAGLGTDMPLGSRGITIKTDALLADMPEDLLPSAVVLPGGGAGARNLHESPAVSELVMKAAAQGKIIAAICAAPAVVLAPLGVLNGRKATCFPGMENAFGPDVTFSEDAVVTDGNIITSRGAGTAFEFALAVAQVLVGPEKAQTVARQSVFLRD